MPIPFKKPEDTIGRFAVVKPWPDVQAAEDENIARLQITAKSLGLECVVIDPEGIELETPHRRVTGREVDFVIHLHFETPKAYDAFSFVVLWNPLRFFRDWGYRRYSRHLLTHDDFLSCSSTWADDHSRRMIANDPTRVPVEFTMYHSLSEPILEPSLGEQKIFYAGINWEKLDKKKKGRHHDVLKILDKDGLVRIHGPKVFQGVNVWEGYRSYVGPVPFDGVSIIRDIARAGISLVLSSDAHKESELMSNRLFESLAAGAVIIADENPFARRHFGDTLLYIDASLSSDRVYEQIVGHLAWIRSNPDKALGMARAAQAIFKERFTLDRSLATIYEKLGQRRRQLEALYAPPDPKQVVQMLLMLPEYSPDALATLLGSATNQTHPACQRVLLMDEWEYQTHKEEIDGRLSPASIQVRPIAFCDRRQDHTCRKRLPLGQVLGQVIESLPPDALFTVVAPNEQLFANHVARLLHVLQKDGSCDFAYSPIVFRHVWDGKTTYDLLDQLNIATNWHLPTGFGRYLFRRSAVTSEQLEVMRYLDLKALSPLVGGLNAVASSQATILSRVQEPFVTGEIFDTIFEHEIALDHLTETNLVPDLNHVKPINTSASSGGTDQAAGGTSLATFLRQLQLREPPGVRVAECVRRLRQLLLLQPCYSESFLVSAEADVAAALQNEIVSIDEEIQTAEKCDSFLAYCVGLCHENHDRDLKALRAFHQALRNIGSEHPLQYLIRTAMKLVRLALAKGEVQLAGQILEGVVLKRQPGNAQAKDLLRKLKGGTRASVLAKEFQSAPAPSRPQASSGVAVRALGAEAPLVSAIVSTYNSEKFLRGCLEDLERQTIADRLEIIVVDSGSTQNERAIVTEFQAKHSNIVYLRTEERETVYAAWNRGIKVARGTYLTNANTDDRHRRDALEVLARTLDLNPEVALVYADCLVTRTENETFETAHPVDTYQWLDFNPADLLRKGCLVGPQPMWRRDVHGEHGYFDARFVIAGDYEFWLRLAQNKRFLHVKETLGLYLDSPSSVEHAHQDQAETERAEAQSRYANVIHQAGETAGSPNPADDIPAVAKLGQLDQARTLVDGKKYQDAWKLTTAALRVRPFHPEAHLLLAQIALAVGDGVSARRCAQRARDVAPGWKTAKQFLKKPLPGNIHPDWLVLPEPNGDRLTVCVIARNEERFLAQCLQSVRGLAHQIIVVDTGSTDRTVEIARQHDAEVYSFPWCDDFSAARNTALEQATGDWILILDADEELPMAQHESLRADMKKPGAIAYRLPLTNHGREIEGQSFLPRLFRNAPGAFFFGRIHEQVFPSLLDYCKEWGLRIHLGTAQLLHHGYAKDVVQDRKKIERNLRMLRQAVPEQPNNLNLIMNLGLELVRSGDSSAGLENYREAFRLMSAQPPGDVSPELREALLTQFTCLLYKVRDYEELVRVLHSPVAKNGGLTASLHFALGLAYHELKQYREAAEQMRHCLAKRHQPVLTPINTDILNSAPGRCLAMCLAQTGAAVEALKVLHQAVAENAADEVAWALGGNLALQHPDFLEFARDWTGEAIKYVPENVDVVAQRAEALLLSGKPNEALPLWRQVRKVDDPRIDAAEILCAILSGESPASPPPNNEANVSQEFLKWYRRLLNWGEQPTLLRLNESVAVLRTVLPGAAAALEAAFTVAAQTTA